jgi:hypothetical protein
VSSPSCKEKLRDKSPSAVQNLFQVTPATSSWQKMCNPQTQLVRQTEGWLKMDPVICHETTIALHVFTNNTIVSPVATRLDAKRSMISQLTSPQH